ncbi:MAG: ubiquinol-cytochrome c reductase iron-sulfur subunit [Actinomycetota bacterium]
MTLNRRNFLEAGWRIGAALLAVAAGWTSWELLRPLKASGASGPLKLGAPGSYEANTATYVMAGRLYVVNTGKTLLALSQKCPHLGCRVPFNEKSGRFECPCHGSIFTINGTRVKGPTPRGMDSYKLSIDAASGDLLVDLTKKIEGKA